MAHALGVVARTCLTGDGPRKGLQLVQGAVDALARARGQSAPRLGILPTEQFFAMGRAVARASDRGADELAPAQPRMWFDDADTLAEALSDPARLVELLAWGSTDPA